MRALLIGNSFYLPGGGFASLTGCATDARRMETFLRHRLDVPADRIRTLTASMPENGRPEPPEPPEDRPSYENVVDALLRLVREVEPGEQVLIYYTGHGGRIPTCIPEVKGEERFDKVLVPWNATAPGARCLRDVELGAVLRDLVERQAYVTLVLDCCHAGDATRLGQIPRQIGVRGASISDERAWPENGLLGDRPSLAATWKQLLEGGPHRHLRLRSDWQPNPRGYVLLAACRAMELAFDFPFEGSERRGIFTRALLEGLKDLAPGFTYRRLHDRIIAEVHSRFEEQTPTLEGDEERVVFGDQYVREPPAVNVLRVDPEGERVLLETGRAQGIERQARFVIQDLEAAPVALAQVTVAGATESWSRVVERYRPDPIEPGFRAVPHEAGAPRLCHGVRLLPVPPAETRERQDAVAQWQAALDAAARILAQGGGHGFVRLAGEEEGADFLVSVDGRGGCEIRDPAGAPLPHLPLLSARSGTAQQLVDLLAHLARFRNVQRLVNRDRQSPLRQALFLEAGLPPVGWEPEHPIDFTKARWTRRAPCDHWLWVKLANTTVQELSVGLFDLQPDWGISLVLPETGDCVSLGPREERVLPLQVSLPPGFRKGTDLLKAVATVGRVDFRWLRLDALDGSSLSHRRTLRGAPRRPADELEALFAALTADSVPKRGPRVPARHAGREWATAHLEIQLYR